MVSELGHVDRVQSVSDARVRVRIMEGLVVWRADETLLERGNCVGRGTSVCTGNLCSDGETMRVSGFILSNDASRGGTSARADNWRRKKVVGQGYFLAFINRHPMKSSRLPFWAADFFKTESASPRR